MTRSGSEMNTPPGLTDSLPELMGFKLFGKTILVVNKKFRLFVGQSTWEVSEGDPCTTSSREEPWQPIMRTNKPLDGENISR